jgi:hypothetical protein
VLAAAARRVGPRTHHQQLAILAGAVGQPTQYRPRRRGVSEQQRRVELQHCERGNLLRTRREVAELRACLLQLGQTTGPVPAVEGRSTMNGLQSEPQLGWRRCCTHREALAREALGLRGLRSQECGIGQHRRGGAGPRRALPAVFDRGGRGLDAHRSHRLHVARRARNGSQEGEALHCQVVEAVAAAQEQRGFELRACPGPIVPLESSRAAAQSGECLQFGFDGQLVDDADGRGGRRRGRLDDTGGELLGHRAQHGQVSRAVGRPRLPGAAQIPASCRELPGLEVGNRRGQR